MTSSMCGPSNALSSLQKHSTADRGVQQDRLQSPASSSQVFRSNATNNKQLDNEFDQFSAGSIPQNVHPHLALPLHQTPAPRLDGWASDFQRLHIDTHQGPVAASQLLQQQPQGFGRSWAAANWHEEFIQRQQQTRISPHMSEPLLRGPAMGMYSAGFNEMGQPMYMGGVAGTGVTSNGTQQSVTAQFDDAAFEQAFENAKAQLEESQDREQLAEAVRETVVVQKVAEEEKKEMKDKEYDSDELARTAAQLLDSLSGNQSQKFQESTFLALMRRLRDREVKVEGDKMVEVSSRK